MPPSPQSCPYDDSELRGDTDTVSDALKRELQERVGRAGVIIDEARLSHLAHAPEIASAMLQRQQAEAIMVSNLRVVLTGERSVHPVVNAGSIYS